MKVVRDMVLGTVAIAQLFCCNAAAVNVMVMPDNGDPVILAMNPNDTLFDVEEQLQAVHGEEGQWMLVATHCCNPCYPQTGYGISDQGEGYGRDIAEGARDYHRNVTAEEKGYIGYIVRTLADKNEASLLFYKSSIESAGKKIDHIHPLKFLETIFTDEELKVKARNVRKKSWVWKSFRDGTVDSLKDEQRVENMLDEYLYEFVATIGNINAGAIMGLYQNAHWKEFVEWLVTNVPRSEDHNRYDMSTKKY